MLSLETANTFYTWGLRFSIVGAAVTLLSAFFLTWGTLVRDRNSATQMANLNYAAAQANERAAEANLELARIKAPRTLSIEQQQRITKKIHQYAGQTYTVSITDCIDALSFLDVLNRALAMAGWINVPHPDRDLAGNSIVRFADGVGSALVRRPGIRVQVAPSREDTMMPVASALATALVDNGIFAEAANSPDVESTPDAIRIVIGIKP